MLLLRSHGRGLIGRRAATCDPRRVLGSLNPEPRCTAARLRQRVHRHLSGRHTSTAWTISSFWRAERDFLYDRLPAPIRLDSGVLAVALRHLREIQGAVRKSWLKLGLPKIRYASQLPWPGQRPHQRIKVNVKIRKRAAFRLRTGRPARLGTNVGN